MALIEGAISGNLVEVTAANELKVKTTTTGSEAGAMTFFSQNDDGTQTGTQQTTSPETDSDYRLRVSQESLLDQENFNYIAQNTGKHMYVSTTATNTWTTAGLTTNASSIITTGAATLFSTYTSFPLLGSNVTYCEMDAGFSAQPVTSAIIDFGLFIRGLNGTVTPTDGAYFRMNSSGLIGVVNSIGTETTIPLNFTYSNSQIYRFTIAVGVKKVRFWIDDILYGEIVTPNSQGIPFLAHAVPFSIRHYHSGTAGGVIQFNLKSYQISMGGLNVADPLHMITNRIFGTYQGLSGGTMGSLTSYTNSTNPTAAVPSNTVLTANLPSGLGGQAWETFTTGLAANIDGILLSYQVPAGVVNVPSKRLRITGVKLSGFVQTALTGGGFNTTFALAFGHTAVSLATTEAAAAKARRIVLLPELTQTVTSGQAINTMVSQPGGTVSLFDSPIYVNPGEFVALTLKHIGTVATAGVIAYNIQYVYSWE